MQISWHCPSVSNQEVLTVSNVPPITGVAEIVLNVGDLPAMRAFHPELPGSLSTAKSVRKSSMDRIRTVIRRLFF